MLQDWGFIVVVEIMKMRYGHNLSRFLRFFVKIFFKDGHGGEDLARRARVKNRNVNIMEEVF